MVTAVTVAQATTLESFVAIRHGAVAALVVSRGSSSTSPTAEVAAIQQQFFNAVSGSSTVRASGAVGVNVDGDPDVKQVIWDIGTVSAMDPGALRNLLAAAALKRPLSALSGLPGPVGIKTNDLVVKMSVVRRGTGQIVVSAAVTTRADDDNPLDLMFAANDLSNGSAVGRAGRTPVFECDIKTITFKPVVDILWIMDELGSMNDNC